MGLESFMSNLEKKQKILELTKLQTLKRPFKIVMAMV